MPVCVCMFTLCVCLCVYMCLCVLGGSVIPPPPPFEFSSPLPQSYLATHLSHIFSLTLELTLGTVLILRRQRELVKPVLFDVAHSGNTVLLFQTLENGDNVNPIVSLCHFASFPVGMFSEWSTSFSIIFCCYI